MKIYEIGTGYTPIPAQMGAATEIVVEELTRSFLKNSEDVEIIDIEASERAETDLPIQEVHVPRMFTGTDVSLGIMHKLKRVCYSIALARKLKKLLKHADEKVVLHFHNQYNLYFFFKLVPKAIREKATIAYTVHSYIWGTAWEEIEETVKKRYFQEIFCVRNADLVLVLNDITVDHFTARLGVSREKIIRIRNGVNVEKYAPMDPEEIRRIKKENGYGDKKIVFQVGSVCERKNQLGSLRMLTEYMQTHRDVVFLYAGGVIDPAYQADIVRHAEENGIEKQVTYVGELAPGQVLNQYYNMADCSVFTSVLESFGLVIIEAISSGTPVVLGQNLMFKLQEGYRMYQSEQEFVKHVDELLHTPKEHRADRRELFQNYSWDAVAKQHGAYFRDRTN